MQEQISGRGSRSWAIPAFNLGSVLMEFEEFRIEGELLVEDAKSLLQP